MTMRAHPRIKINRTERLTTLQAPQSLTSNLKEPVNSHNLPTNPIRKNVSPNCVRNWKTDGNALSLESMPADMEEEFLRQVLEYENAEPTTLFRLLENSGLDIPPPDQLDDDAVTIKLKEIVERMATLGAYLLHTDHLTDRELYVYLFADGLREEAVLFPKKPELRLHDRPHRQRQRCR